MNARVRALRADAPTLAGHLRRREPVTDEAFDALLSEAAQLRSRSFWSSIRACQHAADFFREAGATRVLDVGSGVGKFASVLSLDSGHRVWGVEQRPALVYESRLLAQQLAAEVVITEGGLEQIDPTRFDGFFCFNPFSENISEVRDCFDLTTTRSEEAYLRDVHVMERWLRAAPVGFALVTYNGLGGRIPVSFHAVRATDVNGDVLRLWVKQQPDDSSDAWLELEQMLVRASGVEKAAKEASSFTDRRLVRRLAAVP
ncbi:MAG: class I SAM-dependent methyltransferase [Archangium sp.]